MDEKGHCQVLKLIYFEHSKEIHFITQLSSTRRNMARTRSTGPLTAVPAAAAAEISNNEEGGDESHQFWQGGVAETTPQHGKDRQSYFRHKRQQHQHQGVAHSG